MLTEQTTETMSVSIDSVPLGSYGFLIFDDGRTVLVTGEFFLFIIIAHNFFFYYFC